MIQNYVFLDAFIYYQLSILIRHLCTYILYKFNKLIIKLIVFALIIHKLFDIASVHAYISYLKMIIHLFPYSYYLMCPQLAFNYVFSSWHS